MPTFRFSLTCREPSQLTASLPGSFEGGRGDGPGRSEAGGDGWSPRPSLQNRTADRSPETGESRPTPCRFDPRLPCLVAPASLTLRLVKPELLPLWKLAQERIGAPQPVSRVAGPGIVRWIRYHASTQRIGLDVAKHRPEVIIPLDCGALEPALPDVAHGTMPLVVTPRVGDG